MNRFTDIAYLCRHCAGQLQARPKQPFPSFHLAGFPPMEYRHKQSQRVECVVTYKAEPFDGFEATKKYKEVTGHRFGG